MIRSAASLILRRVTDADRIDSLFLLGNFVSTVVLSTLWLLPTNDERVFEVTLAASFGVLAELPFLLSYKYLIKKMQSSKAKLFVLVLIFGLSGLAFMWVFAAVVPNVYLAGFRGVVFGTINQSFAILNCFFVYRFVKGSLSEFREVKKDFQNAILEFDYFDKNSENRLIGESENLRHQVQQALVPAIEAIKKQMAKSGFSLYSVADQIKDVLTNTVKPLGADLRKSLDLDRFSSLYVNRKFSAWGSVPHALNPRATFDATFTTWLFTPMFITSTLSFTSWRFNVELIVQLFVLWVFLLLGRKALPNKNTMAFTAFVSQQILVWAALILASLIGANFIAVGNPQFKFVLQVGLIVSVTSFLFTYGSITEAARLESIDANQRMAQNLIDAKALFSQRLWIAKRNWSYLVHGRIQSQMLAAQLVAQKEPLGPAEINAISTHLDLVLGVLRNPPRPDSNLMKEIAELKTTWAGIAQIACEFRGKSLTYLETSPELRFAVNEILREAVSNGVKHGEAKVISANVDVTGSSLLLVVSNDGKSPHRTSEKSIGSEMLDELTQSWSLKFHEQTKTVQLTARLALGKH